MGAEESHLRKNVPPKLLIPLADEYSGKKTPSRKELPDSIATCQSGSGPSPIVSESPLDHQLERELFRTPLTTELTLATPDQLAQSKGQHDGTGSALVIDQLDGAGTGTVDSAALQRFHTTSAPSEGERAEGTAHGAGQRRG